MNKVSLHLDRETAEDIGGAPAIAVIGMSGRFPGAPNTQALWRNLCQGVDSISHFAAHELEDSYGEEIRNSPDFAPARSILENVDQFDAEFFGMYPREAALTDPQHRVFLECCWEALEDAGYDPTRYPGLIGVFAGCSLNTYLLKHVLGDRAAVERFTSDFQVGSYGELMGALQDFVATRVCYKLDLKGPGMNVQSACSTSLLAIAQACQTLLNYQADMVLAGGVSITFPQKRGYLAQDGAMVSPDGRCRPFDSEAGGTVFGSGAGVVLLKRLEDAIEDRDHIYAVVRGYGVNNDGAAKVGFTAPSVGGQAAVISTAHAMAGIQASAIGYVEAHGTATPLGDPIEFAGLVQAFRETTQAREFCILGTAKANLGHLDAAAGVTGFIKAALALHEQQIPPLLNYKAPNPHIDLPSSPFRIATELVAWPRARTPRLAGVSSFGVGGTNVHIVLEEAPAIDAASSVTAPQLLTLSARSPTARARACERLADHLAATPDVELGDVAWTLQTGRRVFPYRQAIAAETAADAISALARAGQRAAKSHARPADQTKLAFLFPGQGAQHINMGRELYEHEPVFRDAIDRCAVLLEPHLGADLRARLYPADADSESEPSAITDTEIAQPAIFAVEYALAQFWLSRGLRPDVMVGHSVGEFVAACLAEVFTLEDVLAMVAARGRLMQTMPPGGMLSVRLDEGALQERLDPELSIAAVNAPSLCVIAGPLTALDRFEAQLAADDIAHRRLVTSHAFHSAMMDPVIEPFQDVIAKLRLSAPKMAIISTVTAKPLGAAEATDPGYWARHLRQPVAFSAAVAQLRQSPETVLLEVGPGTTLATLARQHPSPAADQIIASSLPAYGSETSERVSLAEALGALWVAGLTPDWTAVHGEGAAHRRRVSLPTYPFERKRHWVETEPTAAAAPSEPAIATPMMLPTIATPEPAAMQERVDPTHLSATPLSPAGGGSQRHDAIQTRMIEIFQELSGLGLQATDADRSFLDLGFDSLFLTQAARAVQNAFGVKIAFRQLMGDQDCFAALAKFVDDSLPPEASNAPAPAPAMPATSLPVAASAPANLGNGGTPIVFERLVREQLDAMNQLFANQLKTIGAAVAGSSTAEPAAIAPIAPAPKSPARPAAATSARVNGAADDAVASRSFAPIAAKGSQGAEMTPQQEERLRELIARVTAKTPKAKAFTQRYRSVLADPRVVAGFRDGWKEMVYPVVAHRSKGSRIWDVDGNEYIDLLNGFGPIMLGHRPDFLEAALKAQVEQGFEIGPQAPLAGEIAEMFCAMTGNERMTFCNTGSEAVMAALRISRTVTGRKRVVIFSGDYHGMFDEVLIKGGPGGAALPIAPGIPRESVANMHVLDYGTPETLAWIRENAGDLAAVLVEPVQSRHPALQPVAFLKELREITKASGTVLIFDEVVTGFRVHQGGCQGLFGIRADLATYGKVVGGGMPIGLLAGKAEFMDVLDGGMWQYGDASRPEVGMTFFAGTFVRHPLTLAAIKSVLTHFKAEGPGLQERLNARSNALVADLNGIFAEHGLPAKIENFGSVFYFAFPPTERFASLFYYLLRSKGIHLLEAFPCFLTTAHTDEDLARVKSAFAETAAEMRRADFLGGEPQTLSTAASTLPAVEIAPPPGPTPMTEPQREVFLAAMVSEEASCAYNESLSVRLRGGLNIEALRQAFDAVLARHECLRATVDPDGAHLSFAPELKLELPLRDLSALNAADQDREVASILATDSRTAFDLMNGPLVRAEILCLAPEEHLLIITSHHIVCDGWSANVILSELGEIYSATVEGRTADLAPVIPFAEFAQRQSEAVAQGPDTDVTKYWLDQFKILPSPLELPTDRPRPNTRSYAGATVRRRLDPSMHAKLKQTASRQGVSLFVTLLVGFKAFLHRLSHADDIVVGIPFAGQSQIADGSLVGHCVNFLPLRAGLVETECFWDFAKRIKTNVLDAYDHQATTYGTLVRRLNVPRDPSRLPLTEVQFNLEQVGDAARFTGLDVTADPNPKAAVNFDLFFNVIEGVSGLTIDCDYASDLYDRETIERWLGHYETLLVGAADALNAPVAELPLLSKAESCALVNMWNPSPIESRSAGTIQALVERQAVVSPDRIAVRMGTETLTYAELNARANQIGRMLLRSGIGPGTLVAVSFERSLDLVISLLAILKAGGAYVPIDSSYPQDHLTMLLEDSRPIAVLTAERHVAKLPKVDVPVILVGKDSPSLATESGENLGITSMPDDLAYVIYTSGSTGKPKGVEITHRNVTRLLASTEHWFEFNQDDVWTLFHSYAFDFSVWEIWGCLATGGRLVVVPYWITRSPADFYALLAAEQVTVLNQTPAAFYQLIQVEQEQGAKPLALRFVIFGGDALNFANLRPWFARHDDQMPRLVNMYGITETTVHVTYREITLAEAEAETGSLIGHPIPDLRLYILDNRQRPVPIGVAGELYIGGAGVANGYLHRPELTAERFLSDPFDSRTSAKMYRSGDLARMRNDGEIEYLGRADTQVKIHGFRIEPGEIETVLAGHPSVQGAVVMARQIGGTGAKKLVAYVVPQQGAMPDASVLGDYLAQRLPAHMLPTAFIAIPEVPLTVNGKIDRKRLPAPDLAAERSVRDYVAPESSQEKILANIMAEVLRLQQVGVTDNLFELGADSLHVFQITSRAAKAGLGVTPRILLQQRTIRKILAEVEDSGVAIQPEAATIKPVARERYRVGKQATTARVEKA